MGDHRRYKVRDYQFGFQSLQLRENAGLTQAEVAASLGVTERAIQHWEGGSSRPTISNLRKLIALFLAYSAFSPGQEREEARALWEQGCISTSHWHIGFDNDWFTTILQRQSSTALPSTSYTQVVERQSVPVRLPGNTYAYHPDQDAPAAKTGHLPSSSSRLQGVDWGEATDVSAFYGREQELAELEQWILTDRCRLIALLGMGGIGKTTLSVKIAHQVTPHFDFVLWRSLRNAPPFTEFLADCIQVISEQQYSQLPQSYEKCIALFISLLREKRCLLVFDNMETLLQEGNLQGSYREDYEGYGILIQRIAEIGHQSCLLLTSRELLHGVGVLEGMNAPVRTLRVSGLGQAASQSMLQDKGLFGEQEMWSVLVQRYGGNPLALKIVAEAARELFGGDIAAFLHEGHVIFNDILLLLNHQFERLSPLEQDLMYWLAIERDPVSLDELSTSFIHPPSKGDLLEALKSLRQRCLVERAERGAVFTLQPVVLEYITERLVERIAAEISNGVLTLLVKYALMKGEAKEYLRNSQMRLLLQPTLKKLLTHLGSEREIEQKLLVLTEELRAMPHTAQGYAGGNIVNLLVNLRGNIRGVDFSHLLIRQTYLQGIEAQDASFAGADLSGSVFMETFDSIISVALSQDGKYLAVGSFNGQIRIWRVADGKPLLSIMGHSRIVWSIAFSPDSQVLASGSYDRCVKLWDVESGRCIKTLKGHSEWVRAVGFSPDGSLLATSGDDETIRIWNVHDGACLRVLHGHSGAVWSISFHPAGKMLVSGSNDKTMRLWDVATGDCLGTLETQAEQVFSVAFSSDGNFIASGGDGGVRIWDLKQNRYLGTLSVGTSWIWSIAFAPDGALVSGSDDGNVALWDVASGQCLRTLPDHHSRIWSIALAPGNLLASGSHDGIVKLWDATNGQCLRTFQGYNRVICSIAFSPDGNSLVSGDDQGAIRIWEVSNGLCLKTLQGHSGRVWSIVFSPDGKTFASGGNDRSVKVWKASNGQCLKTLQGHTGEIWCVAFSPNGDILASGSLDRTVKLWQVRETGDEDCFRTLQGSNWIWSVAFSPDGSMLTSGSADGEVKLWDVASGQCLSSLESSANPIGAIAFSADGKNLASSSNDEVVRVWEVKSGRSLKSVQGLGNAYWVKSAAFSPDGTMLATGSNDTSIKIWDVYNEQTPRTLNGHEGRVWSVAFSLSGSTLASGGDDGVILLWDTHTGQRFRTLRSDRPFERMNIYGAVGITQAQRASLEALGALEIPEQMSVEALS